MLSESYLYTKEMIKTTLKHLNGDGIMVVQFGELDYRGAPNRTASKRGAPWLICSLSSTAHSR